MKNSLPIAIVFLLGVMFWSCERPKSSNFQVNNQFEVPLTMEKTYPFLGAEEALFDTTSEDYVNLFDSDENELVRLSKEEEANLGDLNTAIPEISVPEIGEVNIVVPPTSNSQTITASGSSTVDNNSFEFRDSGHFVEMDGGDLTIDITNDADVSIDLQISFPEIRDPNKSGYPDESSSLIITVDDITPGETISNIINLEDHQVYAGTDNEIDYEISVTTNGSSEQGGDITTEVGFVNLGISRAKGFVIPKQVLLNEDLTNDSEENIDVFNDDEAEITQIDGIDQISDQVSDLIFENPALNILYDANLGVPTTVYAVIAGTNSQGDTKFLSGKEGTDSYVQNEEIPSQLQVNGQQANANQVIKFDIATVDEPDPDSGVSGSNKLDADKSNASEFFSNLPSNIRFVGVAAVNEKEQSGTIVDPVIFDPTLGVEIPFNLSAENATYQDTVEADFSDLPEGDGDSKLSEASISINYTNGLPLDLSLNVIMLDANGEEIATKNDIAINGAITNENGFVDESNQSQHEISFSESEMNDLHRTRSMVLDINMNTPQQQSVSIRGDDDVTFNLKVRAGITSTIN